MFTDVDNILIINDTEVLLAAIHHFSQIRLISLGIPHESRKISCGLYRNPMLCERLAGRTRILLRFNFLTAITYIYFHANVYYHISMKGDNI